MGGLARGFRCVVAMGFFAVIAGMLAGCSQLPGADHPIPLNANTPFEPDSAVMLPGADYHLVTVRPRTDQTVLCSEPSPDWAKAVGNALSAAASGGVAGGPSASLSGNASATESITAMLGRTAGVVALRDGLYSACQAYANHVIGKDAYALILSQYGNLLVALTSGGGAPPEASPSPASAKPAASAAAVSPGRDSASSSSTGAPLSGNAGPGLYQIAQMQQQAVQAVVVACIGEFDPTIRHNEEDPGQERNPLLQRHCDTFMDALAKALPDLLKPVATSQVAGKAPGNRVN